MSDERAGLDGELAALHAASWGWALACARRDRDRAADVLQDAYAKVIAGRARFDGRSSFKTWFFGVVRLTAREHARFDVRSWLGLASDAPEVPSDAPSPSSQLGRSERARRLASALTKLPDRQREVLHLAFYEDLTLREAAEIMGISIGSARQHYERGKERLRELLAPEAA
jgi:RNA polymerase sigma-70 factor (ECF subfamily)